MEKNYRRLSVDAGNITVMLESKIELSEDAECRRGLRFLDISKGKYLIRISSPNTWDGRIYNEGFINVKNEKDRLVIGDCCYYLGEEFLDMFWHDMDAGANLYGKGVSLNTGGDGSFSLKLEIESLNRKPVNRYSNFLKKLKEYEKKLNKINDCEKLKEFEKECRKEFYDSRKYFFDVYSKKRQDFIDEVNHKAMELSLTKCQEMMREILSRSKDH